MAEARQKAEWARTITLMFPLCMLANSKLRQGGKPLRPSDFDPFAKPDGKRRDRRA